MSSLVRDLTMRSFCLVLYFCCSVLLCFCCAVLLYSVVACCFRQGRAFVDSMNKRMKKLAESKHIHTGDIVKALEPIQQGTRAINILCGHAKERAMTALTSLIPSTKKTLEKFIFEAKLLMQRRGNNTARDCVVWRGAFSLLPAHALLC